MNHLHEWGLGGRTFGGWVTWFLLGGDLYTAYTFVAVPALVYGAGALGCFAVPYTIVVYPLVFLAAPRLWSVAHRHGYVTPADFVRGRHDSRLLLHPRLHAKVLLIDDEVAAIGSANVTDAAQCRGDRDPVGGPHHGGVRRDRSAHRGAHRL